MKLKDLSISKNFHIPLGRIALGHLQNWG